MKAGHRERPHPGPSGPPSPTRAGATRSSGCRSSRSSRSLQACFEARKQLISDVYQITGISDIVRGDTDPHETKGAQQLKSQWGSIRLRDRQKEIARFARDLARIMGEVIADKFQPDTLARP
jgi:hypothetical protein